MNVIILKEKEKVKETAPLVPQSLKMRKASQKEKENCNPAVNNEAAVFFLFTPRLPRSAARRLSSRPTNSMLVLKHSSTSENRIPAGGSITNGDVLPSIGPATFARRFRAVAEFFQIRFYAILL